MLPEALLGELVARVGALKAAMGPSSARGTASWATLPLEESAPGADLAVDATRFVAAAFADVLAPLGARSVKWVIHRRRRSEPLQFHFDSAPAESGPPRATLPLASVALYLVDDDAALFAALPPRLRCDGMAVVDGDPSCDVAALESGAVLAPTAFGEATLVAPRRSLTFFLNIFLTDAPCLLRDAPQGACCAAPLKSDAPPRAC